MRAQNIKTGVRTQNSKTGLRSPFVPRRVTGGRAAADPQQAETAKRILAAAEQAFAEQGLAGARTEQIVRAAGVNKALLYYYFHSKDELYAAVLESLFRQQQAAIAAARENASPERRATGHREELLAYVNGAFDFAIAHPNFPRLIQREIMSRGVHFRHLIRTYWLPAQQRLQREIKEGIAAGEFRPVDPAHTVLSIVAMTAFYFASAPVLHELWGRDVLAPQAVAARREAVLDFLEHGLFSTSARKR
jgi:TetR/AcrR family transcriptional regulator